MGGWLSGRKPMVDYLRTVDRTSNHLVFADVIKGYVKVDKPGYLQARCYDDYYGNVYCGWSPSKLHLKPTARPVYVELDTCSVGDGGLDQVHEVCWFPEGSQEGVLIFSTAHPSPAPPLRPADLYRAPSLGNAYQFNDRLFEETLYDYLSHGELKQAEKLYDDATSLLSSMRDGQEGASGKRIPAKDLHADSWWTPLCCKAGLNVGEPGFAPAFKELESTAAGDSKWGRHQFNSYKVMLPLYSWVDQAVRNPQSAKLPDSNVQRAISGHDPRVIVPYLQADPSEPPDKETTRKYKHEVSKFWIGMKAYLRKDYAEARRNFDDFLQGRHSSSDAFEMAAAAKLRSKNHPESDPTD